MEAIGVHSKGVVQKNCEIKQELKKKWWLSALMAFVKPACELKTRGKSGNSLRSGRPMDFTVYQSMMIFLRKILRQLFEPCPSIFPKACSNLLSTELVMLYYHLILCWPLSPFAFNLSGYFPKSQPFASGGQSIRVSASVLPMNIQDWFPLRCTGWVSLLSKGLSRVFSSTTISKASILWCSTFFMVQLSHPHMTTAKP